MVIYLIGTCHTDLKGPTRLNKFLNLVKPSSICHENSQENTNSLIEYRRQRFRSFLQMGNNKVDQNLEFKIRCEYAYRYEMWVPYQYQQKDNPTVKVYALEEHQTILNIEKILEQNVKVKDSETTTWEKLLIEGLREKDVNKIQDSADLLYINPQMTIGIQKWLGRKKNYLLEDRDALMEQRIREVTANNSKRKTVAI